MNIEVGEYVRTKQGTIGKAIKKYEKYCVIANRRGEIDVLYENIAKHSKNIIDLIEVGDYVNGKEIHEIDENRKRLYSYKKDDYNIILNREIQRVLTKEQFNHMEDRLWVQKNKKDMK